MQNVLALGVAALVVSTFLTVTVAWAQTTTPTPTTSPTATTSPTPLGAPATGLGG